MLVLDSSVALRASARARGFARFRREHLVAPPLLWSEVRSSLRGAVWRGEIGRQDALDTLSRLESAPIKPRTHRRLGVEAWRIAEELGWAKTYDAEFVALAYLLGCRLVTLDVRMRRGADRYGFVVTPEEL